jgi:integrase
MSNQAVTLLVVGKTEKGWRRLPVAFGRNGKIRPKHAQIGDEQVHLPGSYYALRYFEGSKTVWKNVGDNATDALAARDREQNIRQAKTLAVRAGVTVVEKDDSHHTLLALRKKWLQKLEAQGKRRAIETMSVAIDDFLAVTGHTYPEQITEQSMLDLYSALRKRGNSDRTIYNKGTSLAGWFKFMKLPVKEIVTENPSFTEKEVEVYHPGEMKALMAACNTHYSKVVFKLLLQTGLRMGEAMHLGWHNVDLHAKVIRVREQRRSGATIKDRAERSVPMPDDLIATLKEWRQVRPKSRLMVGTERDTPNRKWLQTLKRTVRAAKLNCGQCDGCKGTKECNRWYLHKFRVTYTTTLLRNGVDARTVMSFTGHEDLATVLRYLAPAGHKPMQAKISAIKWT